MKYDVALSFAGEDREYVEATANILRGHGVRVFYDKYEEAQLWGKNLYTHLSDIYSNQAIYTIIFVSKHYGAKLWTNHERESAQARAFHENREYLLPARFDDTPIPGILNTIGYVDLRGKTPEELSRIVEQKLRDNPAKKLRPAHEIIEMMVKDNGTTILSWPPDLALISIEFLKPSLYVTIVPSAYKSLHALFDDLFIHYLSQSVSPYSYGAEWIITAGSHRIVCPLEWAVEPGKSINDLSLLWTAETTPHNEGLLPGAWWRLFKVDERWLGSERYYGLLTNNPDLAKLVTTHSKAIWYLANREQQFSFASLSETNKSAFQYQLVFRDWLTVAPGKILVDRGAELSTRVREIFSERYRGRS